MKLTHISHLNYLTIKYQSKLTRYDDISYLIELVHFFRILDMDEEDAQIKLLKKISETTNKWDDFLPTFESKSNIVSKLNGPQSVNNQGHLKFNQSDIDESHSKFSCHDYKFF